MNIEVYTDGSATVATKPGGYGWVLVVDGIKHSEGNGHMETASNNDAELEAAIQGLAAAYKYINRPINVLGEYEPRELFPKVTLVSDSEIILGWASGRYRFKQAHKIHKFKQLQALMNRLSAHTRWVEGHTGDEHNERCDKLANLGRKGIGPEGAMPKLVKNKKSKIPNDGILKLEFNGKLKLVDLVNNTVQDIIEDQT